MKKTIVVIDRGVDRNVMANMACCAGSGVAKI